MQRASVPSAVSERTVRPLTDREFEAFRYLIHQQAGITLQDPKRPLLVRRLIGRIRELGLDSFGKYHDLIMDQPDGFELAQMLDLITTNETKFFREPAHWELLASHVFPAWVAQAVAGARPKIVRAWSAACSTGQEPYSLAMQMLSFFPPEDGWQLEIVATDISNRVLDTARNATWSIEKAAEIPPPYLKRFMRRGLDGSVGRMKASRELRNAVRFERLNLNDERYAVSGSFDLIFCRNVLIYFSAERRRAVIERLTERLTPTGLLFVGHAESLHAHREQLKAVIPTVYERLR